MSEQLDHHLPAPPREIVDLGGGAGHRASARDPYRALGRLIHVIARLQP